MSLWIDIDLQYVNEKTPEQMEMVDRGVEKRFLGWECSDDGERNAAYSYYPWIIYRAEGIDNYSMWDGDGEEDINLTVKFHYYEVWFEGEMYSRCRTIEEAKYIIEEYAKYVPSDDYGSDFYYRLYSEPDTDKKIS